MWRYVSPALLVIVLAVTVSCLQHYTAPIWDVRTEQWSQDKVAAAEVRTDKYWAWHYIEKPPFTENIAKKEATLNREHEVKCWTCFTLDTLEVSTNNCNRTLCTGKQISACYKWHVQYGFKKYRTYRGCMDNYTEIDYTNAMCRGTGLPLNETCDWSLCKTDYCNSSVVLNISYILLVLIVVYWNPPDNINWPTLD